MSSITTGIPKAISDSATLRRGIRDLLGYRKLLIIALESLLIAISYYLSFVLRFENTLAGAAGQVFFATLPLVLIVKLPVFGYFGLFSGWWRYAGMSDLLDIGWAATISSWLLFVAELWLRPNSPVLSTGHLGLFSVSVIVIDFGLTIFLLGGARFAVRAYTEKAQTYAAQKATLIVGAGEAGSAIVRELKRNPELDYRPVGFVDDDPRKKGIKIHGLPVFGATEMLPQAIADHNVQCVLIAIPSARGKQIERIIHRCRESKVEFKTLPSVQERINGTSASIRQVRSVRVEDLLGRNPALLDVGAIRHKLQDKVVLITGAGGSIGSELARQVAKFRPRKLVFFERSENDLFKLCTEFAVDFSRTEFVPIVGDILDVGLLREVFAQHRPDSVFHAAAYKHVPMMEMNCFQAVINNVFGTYNVALVAKQYLAGDFVMISSDKAVRPTNVMGVTKRIAELIILGLQQQQTRFTAVRFGNVMGSNGSVLPLFEQQIAAGGPVTVTHPEATRYFMTIPEAAQLVLQASSMGQGGEIFMLDMGEPMKIVDLARNLIRLSGFDPEHDIPLVFTGLRPGEKLCEELTLEWEGLRTTAHSKIRVLDGGETRFDQMAAWLEELSASVEAKNVSRLIATLTQIVPEYTPSKELLSVCEFDRHDQILDYRRARADLAKLGLQEAA